MATNTVLLDQMMSRLGQRKSQRLRADLIAEVNQAVQELERKPFIPWFLEQALPLAFASGTASVAIPNFIREVEETRPYYVQESQITYLAKTLRGTLYAHETALTSPQIYTLTGDTNMEIRPVPTKDYTINILVYAKSNDAIADNTNEASNPWLLNAFDYLAETALERTARFHMRDMKAADEHGKAAARMLNDLYAFHESRVHTNQDYYVGGSSGT